MSTIAELEDKVKELLDEIETLKREEKTEKFEYPFEIGEQCWFISSSGSLFQDTWDTALISSDRYSQGNIFKTRQEAERERDKRILLMKFRQFRDKCNGEWEPDLNNTKYYIYLDCDYLMLNIFSSMIRDAFNLFGYFKNKEDCQRAIELFGDEIIRLWVEK